MIQTISNIFTRIEFFKEKLIHNKSLILNYSQSWGIFDLILCSFWNSGRVFKVYYRKLKEESKMSFCIACKSRGSRGFFQVPSKVNRRMDWIRSLSLDEIVDSKHIQHVCFRHFRIDEFKTSGKVLTLKAGKKLAIWLIKFIRQNYENFAKSESDFQTERKNITRVELDDLNQSISYLRVIQKFVINPEN